MRAGSAHAPGVPRILDVAVIGGGMAGLYTGWSLLTRDLSGSPALRSLVRNGTLAVGMFEADRRFGGRLYTVIPPGAPSLRAEMGGMRILRSHVLVTSLVRALDLPTVPFPFGDGSNLDYLRHVRFTQRQLLAAAAVVPYTLRRDERHLDQSSLQVMAIERYVPNAPALDDAQWTEVKKHTSVAGKALVDLSIADLVKKALSPGAWDLVSQGNGYKSFDQDYNAADMMQFLTSDFNNPRYYALKGGYGALPGTLAFRFLNAGGTLMTGASVVSIARTGHAADPLIRLVVQQDNSTFTVDARHVVLGLPRRSVQLLAPDSFISESPRFTRDLNSVASIPASKLLTAYHHPWWAPLGLTSGRSVTDLPIRQCIYFGTEDQAPGGEPHNTNSLLKVSYNDDDATSYFTRFLGGPPFDAQGSVPADIQAPAAMVTAIRPQLAAVHGIAVPRPYWAAYKDWALDPIGAAWHFWRVGQRSYEVMPRIRKPIADANLYVCGEAWSSQQGWVEGALQTTEHVLQDHLGLPWPAWLPKGTSIGV